MRAFPVEQLRGFGKGLNSSVLCLPMICIMLYRSNTFKIFISVSKESADTQTNCSYKWTICRMAEGRINGNKAKEGKSSEGRQFKTPYQKQDRKEGKWIIQSRGKPRRVRAWPEVRAFRHLNLEQLAGKVTCYHLGSQGSSFRKISLLQSPARRVVPALDEGLPRRPRPRPSLHPIAIRTFDVQALQIMV